MALANVWRWGLRAKPDRMKGLSHRLQRLEQKYRTSQGQREVEIFRKRLMNGALAGLTDAEMEHLVDFSEMRAVDPNAQPDTTQQAVLDSYERHYRDFLTAGRVQTIRGCPVDYTGQWPEANGCSVGFYLDVSWWIEGIGYCLDLVPRKPQEWQVLAVNGRL